MNVYLYPSNTEKEVQNIYIGEYKTYEYSYDFRNKTTTDLTNDGWIINTGSPSFNSDGLYQGNTTDVHLSKSIGKDLSNATKIVYSYTATYPSIGASYMGMSAGNNTGNWTMISVDTRLRQLGFRLDSIDSAIDTISAGTYKMVLTIDFENKVSTLEVPGKNTISLSMSDSLIASLKAYGYHMIHLWGGAGYGGQKIYVKDYNMKIYGIS